MLFFSFVPASRSRLLTLHCAVLFRMSLVVCVVPNLAMVLALRALFRHEEVTSGSIPLSLDKCLTQEVWKDAGTGKDEHWKLSGSSVSSEEPGVLGHPAGNEMALGRAEGLILLWYLCSRQLQQLVGVGAFQLNSLLESGGLCVWNSGCFLFGKRRGDVPCVPPCMLDGCMVQLVRY